MDRKKCFREAARGSYTLDKWLAKGGFDTLVLSDYYKFIIVFYIFDAVASFSTRRTIHIRQDAAFDGQ